MYDLTVPPLWDPALWVGGGVSGAESLVEFADIKAGMAPQSWFKLTKIEFAPFVFQAQTQRPSAQAGPGRCCYSHRPGAIYKENEHSKHKHVCGSVWKKQLTKAQTKHPQQ